jgi:hypothetical protein
MKINIWIKKEEVLSGNITKYYTQIKNLGYEDYVQVSITPDEFARLEDGDTRGNSWIIEQYNRNKLAEEQVKSIDEIPFIYERNPDTNKVYRRKYGDYDNKEEVKIRSERIADFSDMLTFIKNLNGGEFREWYDRAGSEDKAMYNKVFEKLQDKPKK